MVHFMKIILKIVSLPPSKRRPSQTFGSFYLPLAKKGLGWEIIELSIAVIKTRTNAIARLQFNSFIDFAY